MPATRKMETEPLLHLQSVPDMHKLYPQRWAMLAIVSLLQISNAMIWICFSPVANITASYYGVSNLVVDFLSLAFMITSVPFGPVASWLLDTHGLRKSVLIGALFNAVGAWLRYASDFSPSTAQLGLLFTGQLLAAMAQPVILDCPTMLAATWFGQNERATANMIASVANPVGVAMGSLFAPMIVTTGNDLRSLYLWFSLPASVGLVLVTLFLRDRPPTAPSHSAENITHDSFTEGIRSVIHNRAYILLTLAFGIGVGVFSALSTLLGQIVNAQGYSNDDAGIFGASMIGFGLLGAIVSGIAVDRTKRFVEIVRICYPGATAGFLMFTLVNRPGQYWLVFAACGISGFFVFAALPVSLELCVECTYPVKEGTSAGMMWMMGQLAGIVFIFTMNGLVGDDNFFNSSVIEGNNPGEITGYADMTNSCWVAAGAGGFGSLLLFFFRSDYKRMQAEKM